MYLLPPYINSGRGASSQTLDLTGLDASGILSLLNAIPKYIPFGETLVLQADITSTASLDQRVAVEGFYGGGQIIIQGNVNETDATVLHTTQEAVWDFKGSAVDGIYLDRNSVNITVRNLRIETDDNYDPFQVNNGKAQTYFYYNYCLINGTAGSSSGAQAINGSNLEVRNCNFSGGFSGIFALANGRIESDGNASTGTIPLHGLRAISNGVVGKIGSQPTGSTSNELLQPGGDIR